MIDCHFNPITRALIGGATTRLHCAQIKLILIQRVINFLHTVTLPKTVEWYHQVHVSFHKDKAEIHRLAQKCLVANERGENFDIRSFFGFYSVCQ